MGHLSVIPYSEPGGMAILAHDPGTMQNGFVLKRDIVFIEDIGLQDPRRVAEKVSNLPCQQMNFNLFGLPLLR